MGRTIADQDSSRVEAVILGKRGGQGLSVRLRILNELRQRAMIRIFSPGRPAQGIDAGAKVEHALGCHIPGTGKSMDIATMMEMWHADCGLRIGNKGSLLPHSTIRMPQSGRLPAPARSRCRARPGFGGYAQD